MFVRGLLGGRIVDTIVVATIIVSTNVVVTIVVTTHVVVVICVLRWHIVCM